MNETPEATGEQAHRHGPTEGTYFTVFLLLAALTACELLTTYLPIVRYPLLLGLSAAKAVLVVQFYMHLKYDNRTLSWIFLIPVIAGIIMTFSLQQLVNGVPR